MSRMALIFAFIAKRELPLDDLLEDVQDVIKFEEQLHLVKLLYIM